MQHGSPLWQTALFFAVVAAFEDPVLAEQLKTIDLRAALKFALESPPPSHSPFPVPSPKKRK
jgi:hypothetical protein